MNKKVKLSWTADIDEVPNISKELCFKAITKVNIIDLINGLESVMRGTNIQDQLDMIDHLRQSLATFDNKLEDIYMLLLSFQKNNIEEKLLQVSQNNVEDKKE